VLEGNIPRFPWTKKCALQPQAHMRAHWQHRECGVTETQRQHRPARSAGATTHPTGTRVRNFPHPTAERTPGKSSHVNVGCRQGGPGR
jgi:hypothetical protein